MSGAQEQGIIGKVQENGLPVIYKFVDELPNELIRSTYSWLTVISWKYDGSSRNGMPPEDANQRMMALEDVFDVHLEDSGLCKHAYSRTGNDLKEFAYYISDRDTFMAAFNDALKEHPRYPIEINFYDDPEWKDFQTIRALFAKASK